MNKESGIFFIRGSGFVRIVLTQDFRKRFSEWQAACPNDLTVRGKITTLATMKAVVQWLIREDYIDPNMGDAWDWHSDDDKIYYVQFLLRTAFKDYRLHGDWYFLDGMEACIPFDDKRQTRL